MRRIGEDLNKLKQKMARKLYADNKWTGLLMSKSESYFSCLDIDERKMDKVFEDDLKFWL